MTSRIELASPRRPAPSGYDPDGVHDEHADTTAAEFTSNESHDALRIRHVRRQTFDHRHPTETSPRMATTTITGIWSGTDNNYIFKMPKRVFQWIYSFSLVLLMVLMIGFVAVTPIDVIVQSTGTSYPAVKLLIVIIVCVVFVVASIVWYFARLFHVRMAMNDVPNKSIYVPFEGDLPADAVRMIDTNLARCVGDIKVKAGPLYNGEVIINHPGMAPPDYIQNKNRKLMDDDHTGKYDHHYGTSLPGKTNYEDIIRSISDKFMHGGGRVLTEVKLPTNYSMREIIIHLAQLYDDGEKKCDDENPDIKRIIKLYEKFRFGPELIREHEFWEFMIEFQKMAQMCSIDYRKETHHRNNKEKVHDMTLEDVLQRPTYTQGSDVYDFYDTESNSSSDFNAREFRGNENESFTSVINPTIERPNRGSFLSVGYSSRKSGSQLSMDNISRNSSLKSLIKDRLSIGRDRRTSRSGLSNIGGDLQEDSASVIIKNSGYDTDSEDELHIDFEHRNGLGRRYREDKEVEEIKQDDEIKYQNEEDNEDDNSLDIYNFRFGRK